MKERQNLKIAIAQINSHIGNFTENSNKILKYALDAQKKGADLVVFPELILCGYPPMDLLDREDFWEKTNNALKELCKKLPSDLGVILGSLRENCYNSAFLIFEGEIKHYQDKTLLPTYDVFDESRYFKAADTWNIFEFKGEKIFMSICEDVWDGYDFNPHEKVGDFDYFINISASPFGQKKLAKRISLVKEVAVSKKAKSVYVNYIGANDELIFDGYSFILDENGELLALLEGFKEELYVYDFNTQKKDSSNLDHNEMADIEKALVLGIKDYFAKNGFSKAVLGLSGGIDSALTLYLAAKALGEQNVHALLMPGPYSSDHSIKDAKDLCENLSISHHILSIKDAYENYLNILNPVFNGKGFDVTEENLQSRIRGDLVMAYSNKFGALALNTGNKSELATGYCTLYGDMAGALAVIGDLYKTQVFDLCRYINREKEIIPWNTIEKPPSAELREDQKDEDSLPPYNVLDSILYEYLELRKPAEAIAKDCSFDEKLVKDVIYKVYVSEYKRRQSPIVLKVSSKAFGSGRRLPISTVFK